MRAFVNWALNRRYRLVLLAAIFALLLPPVAAALLVLETLKRSPSVAMTSALAGLVLVVAAGLLGGGVASAALTTGSVSLFSGVAMGALLRRSQALTLAFQGTVLIAFALVGVLALVLPDPEFIVAPLREQVIDLFESGGGGATPADIDAIREISASWLLSMLVAVATVLLLASLMLGAWWFSLVAPEAEFGREFRDLRLGRVLGTASLVVFALSAFLDVALIGNLAAIAMSAFLFQGLAVMHAWGHAKHWHTAVLAVAYVSFVTPLWGISTFALCATGLLDNIFALRAPLGRQA